MGFDKTFTDVDGDEIQVATDDGAAGSEYLGNVYVRTNGALGVSVTTKRARKIALAILAAADEAEGVTVTTATQITTSGLDAGGALTDGAILFVEEGAYAPVYVETRPNVYLSRRQAREAAFAILRHAR